MLKEAIGTGATVEEAQQAAVQALNAPENADVQFEVLELPVKKTFRIFGGNPAKVRAFYEEAEKVSAPKKEERQKPAPAREQRPKQEAKKEPAKTTEVVERNEKKISYQEAPEAIKKAHDYLLKMIAGMGLENPSIEITNVEDENYLNIKCDGEYNLIIGRKGETLDSIQYLVRLVANRGKEAEDYVRVSINIGNYRQKRENTLKEIARKTALRAIKYNRNIALEPMNPFERRIIHTVVAEMKGVSSHSVGANADRKVIITPEGGGTRPPKSGGGNRGNNNRYKGNNNRDNNRGGNRGNYNNNRRDNNKPRTTESSDPKRAPKSDSAGTSLYGKIEPKN